MRWRVSPSTISGTTTVPGDKSIGHRALMLAGLASGTSTIFNLPDGEDVLSTARCMRALGATITVHGGRTSVSSSGQLSPAGQELDAGNSGTTMRLLAGILAGQTFDSRLTGDASLCRRPMSRIVDPLSQMGGSIATQNGRAPLAISGRPLHGIRYVLPVPSAQIKSAILLAGLFASGVTAVEETVQARDHTERMFRALDLNLRCDGTRIQVENGRMPNAFTLTVPGDISSAAFLFGAAVLGGREISIEDVGLNPTRAEYLRVMRDMGAEISTDQTGMELGEPVGRVTVSGAGHRPFELSASDVPALVDELPLLALLATQANGTSIVRGAAELRIKETDRIATVRAGLGELGAQVEELPDGWIIRGPTRLRGATVHSHGDHRLALMLAIAGTIAEGETIVEGAEAAAVSYPGFAATLRELGASIDEA